MSSSSINAPDFIRFITGWTVGQVGKTKMMCSPCSVSRKTCCALLARRIKLSKVGKVKLRQHLSSTLSDFRKTWKHSRVKKKTKLLVTGQPPLKIRRGNYSISSKPLHPCVISVLNKLSARLPACLAGCSVLWIGRQGRANINLLYNHNIGLAARPWSLLAGFCLKLELSVVI